tara:strand:+ start:319 stop:621 length:303 start_codon:yes stop_codon:yes gene_type:complete
LADNYLRLSLIDICHAVELPEETFVELIQHDIVKPIGEQPTDWAFDITMVSIAKRAVRLQRDLELEWSAVALIEDLLQQREQLQMENESLRQRLRRFLEE